jgi:pyruvate kinase
VQLCREQAKPVIVATQMLDSMIENSRPTRAEVSDVANAVLDGADAVMLSGETSVGKYPVLTVSTMSKIILTTEGGAMGVPSLQHAPRTRGGAITNAAANIASAIGAKALVAFTQSGDTVRRLSRLHCDLPLLACTPDPKVRYQLALSWGVECVDVPSVKHTDDMFRQVDSALLSVGGGEIGDYVVVVAGTPANTPGSTNTLRIHQVGSLADSK